MTVNVCEHTHQECRQLWKAGIGHTLSAGGGSLSGPKMCHGLTRVGKSCPGKAELPPHNEHSRSHY